MIEDQIATHGRQFHLLVDRQPRRLVDRQHEPGEFSGRSRSQQSPHGRLRAGRSAGDAALVALACDQLVMGDATPCWADRGPRSFRADEIATGRETMRDSLAPEKSRSWSLMAALVDPELRVFRYKHRRDGVVDYFCDSELADPGRSRGLEAAATKSPRPGRPLQLKGEPRPTNWAWRGTRCKISPASSRCTASKRSWRWPNRVGPTI